MKRSTRSRGLRRSAWLGISALSVAACERPDYSYSDDVRVVGSGARFTTAGTSSVGTAGLCR